jgi:hypothetical protein
MFFGAFTKNKLVSSQNSARAADCSISFRRASHICVTCRSFKAFYLVAPIEREYQTLSVADAFV